MSKKLNKKQEIRVCEDSDTSLFLCIFVNISGQSIHTLRCVDCLFPKKMIFCYMQVNHVMTFKC